MSCLNSQGPKVYPKSPARATSANEGCHASNGRLVEGAGACSSSHCLPFTAVGRNSVPSSAMKARKASRVPFSSEVLAKARSVLAREVSAETVSLCCADIVAEMINAQVKARKVFIKDSLANR